MYMKNKKLDLIDNSHCTSTTTEVNDLCNKCKQEMKDEIIGWKEAQQIL